MAISMRVKVTIPELVIDSALVRHAIQVKMQTKTGPDLQKEFKRTVEGWSNPPPFNPHVYHGTTLSTVVYTESERYNWVNFGTPAHRITPKGRGLLRFQPGYRAATRPGVIGSSRPSRFGDHVSSRGVYHPGVEARNFDQVIAEAYAETFVEDIQDAIKMAVEKGSVGRR